MKLRKFKILLCVSFCCLFIASIGIALADVNTGFGKTITTAQMANMFGGGFVLCGDTDCDTVSATGCSGGSTSCSGMSVCDCYNCKSGFGSVCGAPNSWPGWMCENAMESCFSGSIRSCHSGYCEIYTGAGPCPPQGNCGGTRPNCS